MCGIVACISNKHNATEVIFSGLKKLEYRGYDSWGIAIKKNNAIEVEKHIGKIATAKPHLTDSNIGIGHTRWATHGGVTKENAHPHLDCTKNIVVIHNGIVENYLDIKAKLLKSGHQFVSETDTEVIAHMIEEEKKTKSINDAVFDTFNQLIGSNAIVVLDSETETIIACRNGSPLVAGVGDEELFLASDVTPFLQYTNKVLFLNDTEGVVLKDSTMTLYDLATKKTLTPSFEFIDWKQEDTEKGHYPHFLLKEINEQKNTITDAVFKNIEEIDKLSRLIKTKKSVALIGCGSAYYCCLLGRYYFAENNIHAEAIAANEFMPFAQFYTKESVVIAVSQSGETADTLLAVKLAKKNGAMIVAIVNTKGSSLERIADLTINVFAGPEIAVVSTKAFTAQVAVLYALCKITSTSRENVKTEFVNFSKHLTLWLNDSLNNKIIALARHLVDKEHIFLIGKSLFYPAALEAGLKIKETSYIHAESFAAGELKHGVITLIQKSTPCLVFVGNDKYKNETLSAAIEIKSRGAEIIGIAPFTADEFSQSIETFDCGSMTSFAAIIFGQLLGYYLGIGRGADPDKPRNLAKSVTVK